MAKKSLARFMFPLQRHANLAVCQVGQINLGNEKAGRNFNKNRYFDRGGILKLATCNGPGSLIRCDARDRDYSIFFTRGLKK